MICDKLFECVKFADTEKTKEEKINVTKGKKTKKKNKVSKEVWKSPCNDSNKQCQCVQYADTRPRAQCQEKGKSYVYDQSVLDNKQMVVCMHIDNGAVNGSEANDINKCDYSFFIKNTPIADSLEKAILVELKVSDVDHALEQLKGTLNIKEFKDVWNNGCPIYGRVVCSRVPGVVFNESVIKEKREWTKKYKGSLIISSGRSMTDICNKM